MQLAWCHSFLKGFTESLWNIPLTDPSKWFCLSAYLYQPTAVAKDIFNDTAVLFLLLRNQDFLPLPPPAAAAAAAEGQTVKNSPTKS